jgi:hypothetical protein
MKTDHEKPHQAIQNHFNTSERELKRLIHYYCMPSKSDFSEYDDTRLTDQRNWVHNGLFISNYSAFKETRWWILFPWQDTFVNLALAVLTGAILCIVIVIMSVGVVGFVGWVLSLHGWVFALVVIPIILLFTFIGGIVSQ